MTLGMIALLAGFVTFIASVLLPYVVRPILVRLGIMDIPNERSSHERPVLRGLGLAVLIAMLLGGAVAIGFTALNPAGEASLPILITLIVASLAAGLLGLREDLAGLSVTVRSVALLGIAVAAAVALLRVVPAAGQGPTLSIGLTLPIDSAPAWALVLLTIYAVLFISSYINVANFMDGLNGISGLHGVIGGATFTMLGWLTGLPWLMVVGLLLAAAYAGFLPWNLSKPGAFLGDVGSYLLGGATAITSFAAFVAGVPLLASIGPMVIYFGDVGVTLVKRVRAGHHWDEPHKEHVYQRIQQLGYSHLQASLMAAACTAVTSLLGIIALFTHLMGTFTLFVAGFVVLGFYLLLPRLLPPRSSRDTPGLHDSIGV